MNINHILETFTKSLKTDEKSSLTRLLTAFYFKSHENLENILDQTFEFTHKSFSDYLISLKTCTFLGYLSEDLLLSKRTSGGRGKNILNVSENFIAYFSAGRLQDGFILQFLKNQLINLEDRNSIKEMLVEILKFISVENETKSISFNIGFHKINKEFSNVYTNLIVILDTFCKLDGNKIDLDSTSLFSFLSKFISKYDFFESSLITNFVINNQLGRMIYFASKLNYSIRLLEQPVFFSMLNNYIDCEISYNEINEKNILVSVHNNYRRCNIEVENIITLHFISCSFVGCNFRDIKELNFNDSYLINVEFNNIDRIFLNNLDTHKNLKINGILIDDLNGEQLEELGVYLEKDKEIV